ncbi:hypothetical protein [Streptomyces scopuliridis]|uniref:hypothetical protein n=1 Tax=Streptomyces scopuliridis TaxID=452529 RepID=UPI00344374C8
MPHSRAELAEVAKRRANLIRLRRAGVAFDDPQIRDLGYKTRGHASKDLIRALQQNRDEEAAEAGVYRQQENERLDSLLEAAWPLATTPRPVFNKEGDIVAHEIDLKAVDTVLKLMDRRAKLNGLDMPVKNEVSGPDGGVIPLGNTLAELTSLMTTAGDPETATGSSEGPGDDSGA